MKIARRILFIPLSAIVAVAIAFGWRMAFTSASYSGHDLFHSIVGLAPLVIGRLLPVSAFVVLGTMIAPNPGRVTIACLGVVGGLFAWPFGPTYEETISGPIFYRFEAIGALAGAAAGILIAFAISRKRRSLNQAPEASLEKNPTRVPR